MTTFKMPEPNAYQYLFDGPYGEVWRNDSAQWNGGGGVGGGGVGVGLARNRARVLCGLHRGSSK